MRCRCGELQAKGPDALGRERIFCAECGAKLCCWHYVLKMFADHKTGSVLLLPHCHPSCADSMRTPLVLPQAVGR
jgi:hypothetical protein